MPKIINHCFEMPNIRLKRATLEMTSRYVYVSFKLDHASQFGMPPPDTCRVQFRKKNMFAHRLVPQTRYAASPVAEIVVCRRASFVIVSW